MESIKPAMRVRVHAPGAPNPLGRFRGAPGDKSVRRWPKDARNAVVVEVVDAPKSDAEISPACLVALQADPYIKVDYLAGDPADVAAGNIEAALKAEIAEKDAAIARLRADLASESERLREDLRLTSQRAEEIAEAFKRAQSEIGTLRDQLVEARAAKGKRA